MCLIIHKPTDGYVDLTTIQSAQEHNQDGSGYMSKSGIFKWDKISAKKIYDRINADDSAAIHFRMATHGKVDADNTHPFKLSDGGYLMHNGILSQYAPDDGLKSDKSDTKLFCERFCDPIIQETGKLPLKSVEDEIGRNAVAIMSKNNRITRLGTGWNEYNGAWFSNQYAWDCPSKYAPYYDDYDASALHYSGMDELADDYLYTWSDELPLETDEYISVCDLGLYDDIYDRALPVDDFLGAICPETKLSLLAYLIKRGYITP